MSNFMRNITPALLELRQHYESRSTTVQSQSQGSEVSELLQHVDALLLSELIRTQESDALPAQLAPQNLSALPSAPPAVSPKSTTPSRAESESIAKVEPSQKATSDRTPRQLQPAYEGLTRNDAITQALQTTAGQEMTTDSLITELFGSLSISEQKAEAKRLYTLLYNGEKKGLWQKGKAPRSYLVSKAKATKSNQPTTEASKAITPTESTPEPQALSTASTNSRGSLELLPEFEGMSKLTAITKVLSEQAGQVLHQDTIFAKLYGEQSPAVVQAETKKLRASLFQGVNRGLWQKAPKQPSSYLVKAAESREAKDTAERFSSPVQSEVEVMAKVPSTKKPGRPPGLSSKSKPAQTPAKASRGREQVLSLPAEFEGLSKIEAVSKVLSKKPGIIMHIEDIIERFYGELPKDELKAEKDRMKDVMTRGVKRGLWSKASGVPSSFVAADSK